MAAGAVQAIFLAPRARVPLEAVAAVRAVPGLGLEGDRYFLGRGALSRWPGPARAVSLIEAEVLEAVRREHGLDLSGGRSRRNLVTAGLALPELKGRTFRVGGALLRGIGPCSPCGYLDRLAGAGACAALKGRGGLRAAVLEEGVIRVGDAVELILP
jgi:MOSC domain-containing protein YiiM